jgi:stage II sporulation protein AA (anti-sigma F factor antagonist)
LVVEHLTSGRGFRLRGALDLFGAKAFKELIEPELHGELVLDLAEVEFIDETGLAAVIRALLHLREHGGSLVIRNPSAPVRRVLEVTGVSGMPGLHLEDDDGAAPV